MNHTIDGNLEVLNSLQLSSDLEGMDTVSKDIFKNKEVLAVILKGVVSEYEKYTTSEIMDFIEADSITSEDEVSTGRTNTRIRGENNEFVQLNEKTSNFDIRFLSRNPELSGDVRVNLHIDVEPQRNYKPGYPIEKRGMYYLARSLSSQLSLIMDNTDYNSLEKCYSIWICRDNVPPEERYSISYYQMENSRNIGDCHPRRENYDLLNLIIIRLGEAECSLGEGMLEFLSAIFYPHKKNFLDTVQKYIDFSHNKELLEEVSHMSGLGMSILEEGMEKGLEKGMEEGMEKGRANQLIDSVANLMKSLSLSMEEACKALNIDVSEYEKARELTKNL